MDNNSYSLIIIPDIIRYCGDLMVLFIQIFASLQDNGITIFVCRIITNDKKFRFSHTCLEEPNTGIKIVELENIDGVEENVSDEKEKFFISAIEEFSYSPYYIESTAKSCGFNIKMSLSIPGDFALFLLQKP
jgi:predicted TPR repeat methyltransferase